MKEPDPTTPGGRFTIARKRAGLTQKALETASGVNQSTISDFENGKIADILASNLVAMCVEVDVSVEYVLRGTRAARSDEEAEAIGLLRGASDAQREMALGALRGMLSAPTPAAPTKRRDQRAA